MNLRHKLEKIRNFNSSNELENKYYQPPSRYIKAQHLNLMDKFERAPVAIKTRQVIFT